MHSSRLEDAKDQLIADALKIAGQRKGGATVDRGNVRDLLNLYYHHVAPEDIHGRSGIDLYGAAMSHYRLAKTRPQGTAAVRVFTPSIDDNEWVAAGHSVIEVVTDDMPFLVDSVTMALTADDREIHVVIHPQLLVRRDVTGQLHELRDGDRVDTDLEPDLLRESWMHIEIDRESDPAELQRIEQTLVRVLSDVREAVEDWAKMREQACRLVSDLEAQPPPLPVAEVTEGGRCWSGSPMSTSPSSATASISCRLSRARTCCGPSRAPALASCGLTRTCPRPLASSLARAGPRHVKKRC
ncbi:MAG: hypothetical protein WKF73_12605 [Nocardioidaceae bacterium]